MRMIHQALQKAADFTAAKRKKGKVPQRPTPVPSIARGPAPPVPTAFPKKPKGAGGY